MAVSPEMSLPSNARLAALVYFWLLQRAMIPIIRIPNWIKSENVTAVIASPPLYVDWGDKTAQRIILILTNSLFYFFPFCKCFIQATIPDNCHLQGHAYTKSLLFLLQDSSTRKNSPWVLIYKTFQGYILLMCTCWLNTKSMWLPSLSRFPG